VHLVAGGLVAGALPLSIARKRAHARPPVLPPVAVIVVMGPGRGRSRSWRAGESTCWTGRWIVPGGTAPPASAIRAITSGSSPT